MICSSHGPNSTGVVLPLRDLRGQIVHLVAAPACKHSNSGQHVGADLAACSREHPNAAAPNLFGTRDRFCGRQSFQTGAGPGGQGGFGMIQAHHIQAHFCCTAWFLTGPDPYHSPSTSTQ